MARPYPTGENERFFLLCCFSLQQFMANYDWGEATKRTYACIRAEGTLCEVDGKRIPELCHRFEHRPGVSTESLPVRNVAERRSNCVSLTRFQSAFRRRFSSLSQYLQPQIYRRRDALLWALMCVCVCLLMMGKWWKESIFSFVSKRFQSPFDLSSHHFQELCDAARINGRWRESNSNEKKQHKQEFLGWMETGKWGTEQTKWNEKKKHNKHTSLHVGTCSFMSECKFLSHGEGN